MSVLVVVAHPDDEVLGCGGTIARWANEGRAIHVLIMADGESSRGSVARVPLRNSAAESASALLSCASVEQISLPDQRMDSLDILDVTKLIEVCVERYKPVTVLTHHAGDVNRDHRITHEAVVTACRPYPGQSVQELLFFEVPSSTEWQPPYSAPPFCPAYFVEIALDLKLAALDCYPSEMRSFPHPRSVEAIGALARWRGAQAGMQAAEAFMIGRRLLFSEAA